MRDDIQKFGPTCISFTMLDELASKELQFLWLVEQVEEALKLDEEEKMLTAELHYRRRCIRIAGLSGQWDSLTQMIANRVANRVPNS